MANEKTEMQSYVICSIYMQYVHVPAEGVKNYKWIVFSDFMYFVCLS